MHTPEIAAFQEKVLLKDDGESVVRLFNRKGEHVLSVLPCDFNGDGSPNYDLAKPDGTVVSCCLRWEFVNELAEALGVEKTSDKVRRER